MTQPKSDSSGRWFILAILGVFVLGGLGIAVAVNKGGTDDVDNLAAVAPVDVLGDAIPAMPQGVNITTPDSDPAVGMKAPELVGTDFTGEEVSIKADGRPKVIFFLAHWCPHCQQEVPQVISLSEDGSKPEGVDFYAVSTAVDASLANYPPARWLGNENWSFPIVRDNATSDAHEAYGQGGFPYTVYLDGDNNVLFRSAGQLQPAVAIELWNLTAASVG